MAIAKPAPQIVKPLPPKSGYPRKNLGKFAGTTRIYKPKATRGRPMNRNMTLTNDRRPPGCVSRIRYIKLHISYSCSARRRKYVDKPCPRFNTTGEYYATCNAYSLPSIKSRCLLPRSDMPLHTRCKQDCYLLAIPARLLSKFCLNLPTLARPHSGAHTPLCSLCQCRKMYEG